MIIFKNAKRIRLANRKSLLRLDEGRRKRRRKKKL